MRKLNRYKKITTLYTIGTLRTKRKWHSTRTSSRQCTKKSSNTPNLAKMPKEPLPDAEQEVDGPGGRARRRAKAEPRTTGLVSTVRPGLKRGEAPHKAARDVRRLPVFVPRRRNKGKGPRTITPRRLHAARPPAVPCCAGRVLAQLTGRSAVVELRVALRAPRYAPAIVYHCADGPTTTTTWPGKLPATR